MSTVLLVYVKGGPGSGNWGHAGRPGLVGGSAPTRGAVAAIPVPEKVKIAAESMEYRGWSVTDKTESGVTGRWMGHFSFLDKDVTLEARYDAGTNKSTVSHVGTDKSVTDTGIIKPRVALRMMYH